MNFNSKIKSNCIDAFHIRHNSFIFDNDINTIIIPRGAFLTLI